MSPFAIAVIFILTVLFGLLSLTPVLPGSKDMDSFESPAQPKTRGAH